MWGDISREFIAGLYDKAQSQGYAIGAFNFSTMEILKGIHAASRRLNAPVIISNSEGERSFFGMDESIAVYKVLKSRHPATILHADHTKTFEELKRVVDAGYPSVHFDGSELAYEINLRETKKCVQYAHSKGVFIEAELGGIRGGSTVHSEGLRTVVKDELLTKPGQAKEFCDETGVDSLAVSVGNAHGIWKEQKKIDFERIKAVKQATGRYLVLHGGSGISAADFRKAVLCGINKININTETRVAFEQALSKGLAMRTDSIPYHYLGMVSAEVAKVIEEKLIIFKCENKA